MRSSIPDSDKKQTGHFLGRRLRWETYGLTWQGDDKIVEELLKDWDMVDARPVDIPGVNEADYREYSDERPMDKDRAGRYRSAAAKLNYTALDNVRAA